MKVLGYHFNARGDSSTHIDKLSSKFRKKVWTLRHLRKSNFAESELLQVYTTYLRPTLEYSSPIYHSMITSEQSNQLERQQFFALKNIYGFCYSNRQLLELSQIPTLKQRREEATLKFAQKTANNPRFAGWFQKRKTASRRTVEEEVIELPARTDRRKKSPLFHYRRVLNEHRIEYDVRKTSLAVDQ